MIERKREHARTRERERECEKQTDRQTVMVITAQIVFSLCLTCIIKLKLCIIKLFSIHNLLLYMCSNPTNLLHCNFRNTI